MHSAVMQDWTTIRGSSSTTDVIQGEDFYVDAGPYQDGVFWIEVREVTAGGATTLVVLVETSPNKDNALFVTTAQLPSGGGVITVGVTTNKSLMSSATNPIGRWLRWHVQQAGATATWDITFRLLAALNSPGR